MTVLLKIWASIITSILPSESLVKAIFFQGQTTAPVAPVKIMVIVMHLAIP